MHVAQGFREGRKRRNIQGLSVVPLRQGGDFGQRRIDRLAERFLKEPFGGRIDRLHRRHSGKTFAVQHMVWMHDLPMPVPKLQLAGNPAGRAGRQAPFNPMMIGEKEDEEDVAGLVFDQDLVGRLGAGARRHVLDDLDFERDDRIERRIGDFWPVAAVDGGIGEMEKKVEHAGVFAAFGQESIKELGRFRPDAGQACGCREERIEERGTHGAARIFS